MSRLLKQVALDYLLEGQADISWLSVEEIKKVLNYVQQYGYESPSKIYVPNGDKKFIVDFSTLKELIYFVNEI